MPIPLEPRPPRALLRDDVFAALLDAIVTAQLAPGERLRDQELGQWLGVSRTPVREALLRLERLGLVIARPGSATVVAPEDPAATTAAAHVAAALHELATRTAVPRLGPADLAALGEANRALASAMDASSAPDAIAADDAFHAVFLRVAGNPVLAESLAQVTPLIRRAERLHFDALQQGRESTAAHERIIGLATRGEADAAAVAVRENWLTLA